MKIVVLGLLVLVWQSVPTSGLAAPKGAAGQKATGNSAAEKAMDECTAQYCGRRSCECQWEQAVVDRGLLSSKNREVSGPNGRYVPLALFTGKSTLPLASRCFAE
jgi:hypothetical protein